MGSESKMGSEFTYSHVRNNLARVMDAAEDTREPVVIKRRNHEDMALLPASELRGLQETAHLLRSPKNARRLLTALVRALEDSVETSTAKELRDEFGL